MSERGEIWTSTQPPPHRSCAALTAIWLFNLLKVFPLCQKLTDRSVLKPVRGNAMAALEDYADPWCSSCNAPAALQL